MNWSGSCFDENSDELEERVRSSFKNRGYFNAQVKILRIQPSDSIAVPKPVVLEADVLEGPLYRLAEIGFVGNHAVSTPALRSGFPLKKGDRFGRDKIASGLDALRDLYVSSGFIDFTAIPDTRNLSNATVILSVSVMEGQQYHMGKLEIFAKKEVADRLRTEWQLPEGAVFDLTYLDKYIGSNRSLLPTGFQREHMQLVRDCRDATVDVRLPLDAMDPRSQSDAERTSGAMRQKASSWSNDHSVQYHQPVCVILSEEFASPSEANPQSKDPYLTNEPRPAWETLHYPASESRPGQAIGVLRLRWSIRQANGPTPLRMTILKN